MERSDKEMKRVKQALKKHDNKIAKWFEEIETKHGQKLTHLRHKAELQNICHQCKVQRANKRSGCGR